MDLLENAPALRSPTKKGRAIARPFFVGDRKAGAFSNKSIRPYPETVSRGNAVLTEYRESSITIPPQYRTLPPQIEKGGEDQHEPFNANKREPHFR